MSKAIQTAPNSYPGHTREAFLLVLLLGLLLTLIYAPFVVFLFRTSIGMEQLHLGGVLVLVMIAAALRDTLRRDRIRLSMSNYGLALLGGGAFFLMLAGRLPRLALPLVTISFCSSFGALIAILFGEIGVRRFLPVLVGMTVFGVLVGLFPTLDWPLRSVAARYSAGILAQLGVPVQLALVPQRPPELLLEVRQRVFSVASECSGFGLLTSSLLVAAVLAVRRPMSWGRRAGLLGFSALAAIVFNMLRIVGISLMTVHTGLPYSWIHEGLGTLLYLAGLGLIWWVA